MRGLYKTPHRFKNDTTMNTTEQILRSKIEEFLQGTGYELITLAIRPDNNILVEVDKLEGTDVDFCAELNRQIVEFLESVGEPDYALEVGSVSLVDPFKTKMQYNKHLGHNVEVMAVSSQQSAISGQQWVKYRGQLVSVDEETFSVDVEEKVKVEMQNAKCKMKKQIVTHTWRYDEVKYCKYDLKF